MDGLKDFFLSTNFKITLTLLLALIFVLVFVFIILKIYKKNVKIKAELNELDYLTRIYNRGYFYKKSEEFLKTTSSKYSIVAFDISRFKNINEYYGSDEADNILKDVGLKLIEFYNNGQIKVFGRIESDKFAWIMQDSKDKIVDIYNSLIAISQKYRHQIPVKLGVYQIEDNNMPIKVAYNKAFLAGKSIKNDFDRNIQYFDAVMVSSFEKEQYVLNNFDKALENEEIIVFFQPKYDLQDNLICGAEALVRWADNKNGMISPAYFIPALENNGLITKLDKYIWDRTARYIRDWCRLGLNPKPVSINISKVDLLEPDLPNYIESIVRKYAIPHNLFELEITESAYVDGAVDVTSILKAFKNKGFTILMDDFGSGYSSLNTLRQFPIDVIKIDLKFLTNFDNSAEADKGRTIIESIVSMAKRLKLRIVVEGIETSEQANYCKSIGCEVAQGFFFANPIPEEEYIRLLNEERNTHKDLMFHNKNVSEDIWNKNTLTQDYFNNVNGALAIISIRRDCMQPVKLNENYFRIIEQQRKEFYAATRNLYESIYPKDLDMFIENIGNARKEMKPQTFLYRRINSNGNIKWIKATATYINSEDNITHLYFLSLDDVTEVKNMQRDVLEMADSFDSGIIKCDISTNKVVFYNDKILEILGITKEEFDYNYKNNYLRLISPDAQKDFKLLVENARDKEIIRKELSLVANNKEVDVLNTCKVLVEGNKKYTYFWLTEAKMS